MNEIKVLVVDDSPLFRRFLQDILAREPSLTVIGTASDASEAARQIAQLNPDVITLDVEMPGMNGIAFLKRLMQTSPKPVVMVSSYTEENSSATIEALTTGAMDFVLKPVSNDTQDVRRFSKEVINKVKMAAQGKMIRPAAAIHPLLNTIEDIDSRYDPGKYVVAIGASSGGTQAVYNILRLLPANIPAIVVVQHMPAKFTSLYALRMNELCNFPVKEAQDEEELCPGRVLIAPGDKHLKIENGRSGYQVKLVDSPPVNFYKPSINMFFQSVANTIRDRAIGIILTGMGKDGAQGLLAMRRNGAYTIAQDESTCVIFGMPKVAVSLDAVCEVAPIHKVSECIISCLSGGFNG